MKQLNFTSSQKMEFSWMGLTKICSYCKVVHPNSSCVQEILLKMSSVIQKGILFYSVFHIVPFLFRLKKILRERKFKQMGKKLLKNYIGSIVFMSFVVGGNKLGLCINSHIRSDILSTNGIQIEFYILAIFSSLGVFFQSRSRRQEIIFFALVRACRSLYVYFKRRYFSVMCHQQYFVFLAIFGVLSYIYHQFPDTLKYKEIFTTLWGQQESQTK